MCKCIFSFFEITSIIGGFAITLLTCIYLKHTPENLEKEIKNWNVTLIKEIKVFNNSCPIGYEPLISSVFKGSYDVCDCTNSTSEKYKGLIFYDICEKEQGIANCTIHIGEKERKISNWRGKAICIKRTIDLNYFYYLNKIKTLTCRKSEYYIDTEGNELCPKVSEVNPINYLKIDVPNLKINYTNEIPINKESSIYWSNNYPYKTIIANVEITSNDRICASSFEGKFSENKHVYNKLYGNSTCKTSINNSLFDERYNLIDEGVNYIDTLKQNNITKYNYLDIKTNQTLKLYSSSYFGIKTECLNDVNLDDFLLKKITFVQIVCYIICIISGILSLSCLFFTILCCHFSHKFDFFVSLFSSFIFYLSVLAEIVIYIKTSSYSTFHSYECLDALSQYNFWNMYYHIWYAKILIGVTIVLYSFHMMNPYGPNKLFRDYEYAFV